MEKLGAERANIVVAIGPLIRQPSYEVGSEFVERFVEADARTTSTSCQQRAKKYATSSDLAGFIRRRLENAGI